MDISISFIPHIKDKDSKIKTVTTSSAYTYIKTSALKKHNFYKVKVRAYALNSKNEKMYGSWSSWKYVSPQPDVTKIKNNKSKKGIQISWDKIKGANRYVVYVSTKKDSGYKKFRQLQRPELSSKNVVKIS